MCGQSSDGARCSSVRKTTARTRHRPPTCRHSQPCWANRPAKHWLPSHSSSAKPLVLSYWGGYTQREIAILTSTPVGTVKTRMHHALKELKATLSTQPVAERGESRGGESRGVPVATPTLAPG